MRYKECWSFDPVTSEYLGMERAYEDPMGDDEYVLPAYATFVEPPEGCPMQTLFHHTWVFNGTEWVQIDDWRGEEYWLPDGSYHKITEIGICPPENHLKVKPLLTMEEKQEYVFGRILKVFSDVMTKEGWTGLDDVLCRNMSDYPEWKEKTTKFIQYRNSVLHNWEIRKGELNYTDPDEFLKSMPVYQQWEG